MDGLMVDSEPQWLLSEIEITAKFGYNWTPADQVACLGGPLSRVGEYMHEKCNFQEDPGFFTQSLISLQAAKMKGDTPLMPGAFELVKELQGKGVKTALVSASPRIIVDAVLENIGTNLFPFSISSDDVLRTKPFPDAYLKAADIAEVDISNSLIFEDSLTGVKAAQSSGAWLIAVPHLVHVEENERTRVIRTLEQVSYQKLSQLHADYTIKI